MTPSRAKGGLEEGGAERFHAAFGHFDFAFVLAAFLESWVIAHEGLEANGGGAIAAGLEKLFGQIGAEFGGGDGAEAGEGLDEAVAGGIGRLEGQLLDLAVEGQEALSRRRNVAKTL